MRYFKKIIRFTDKIRDGNGSILPENNHIIVNMGS